MNFSIHNIFAPLSSNNTAIFCGAGISYNSGLPIANDLVKKTLVVLGLKDSDASIILNSNIPFEFFIQTITNEVDVEDILDIFNHGEPNTNHELIAELVYAGLIKTIVTTNFDLLIEKALLNKGFHKGADFEIFSSEKEFGQINWSNGKVKLIKIHGCVLNKAEMAITLNVVATKTLSVNRNAIIKNVFSKNINDQVFVIGYSCSDLFDISPQIESIEENRSDVFFVEHVNNTSSCTTEDISLKEYKNPFKNFSGTRIYVDADLFIKELWLAFIKEKYQLKSSSTSWSENVHSWIHHAIETNSIGIKSHIPARLYYNIGEYDTAVKHFEYGISIAQSQNNQITFYSELGNLGMTFNALGRYEEAKRCLEESVKACHDLGSLDGEISQLQALGNVYRNLGEFESAIVVYKKSVALAEREDLFGLCTALGNLASIYSHTNEPDEAIKCLERGLEIALHIGNKQSEGSMACSLGIAFYQKGDSLKATKYILYSIETTRLIGDKQGECMALLNLSNVNLQESHLDECITNANLCLDIAQKIGSRQGEGLAYYNIGSAFYFKGDSKSAIPFLEKAKETFLDIYGLNHRHTEAAIKAINRGLQFPDSTVLGDLNFI